MSLSWSKAHWHLKQWTTPLPSVLAMEVTLSSRWVQVNNLMMELGSRQASVCLRLHACADRPGRTQLSTHTFPACTEQTWKGLAESKYQSRLENGCNLNAFPYSHRCTGRGWKFYWFKVIDHNLCAIISWPPGYADTGWPLGSQTSKF